MASTTVRVDAETHQKLRSLAMETGRPITLVVADAVAAYEKKRFWDDVRASVARLKADPEAWADYRRELDEWDAVLMDGLEDDPYFDETHPR